MPTRLPTSKRTSAFRLFVRTLKNSPVLDAYIKTWRVWEGESGEESPWASEELPRVRISWSLDKPVRIDTCTRRSDLLISMEVAVPGTDADTLSDLWTAIDSTLCPTDPARQATAAAAWHNVGVDAMPEPEMGGWEPATNGKVLTAKGTVRLVMVMPA